MNLKTDRPRIMITGFYGVGNSGDEAMLRNFVFKMKERLPNAVILVASDAIGEWAFNDVYYISPSDRSQLAETDMFVVGGGDLGVGFGWNLLPWAKIFKNKCVMMSNGINDTWRDSKFEKINCGMLELFDEIYVRNADSHEFLNGMGIANKLTTDMAFDLYSVPISFRKREKHITLCIREVEHLQHSKMYECARAIIKRLLTEDYSITLLPLCKEDAIRYESFKDVFNTQKLQFVYTTDPQHHKHIIEKSTCVISLGRLHPLVYAASASVPMIAIEPPKSKVTGYSKIKAWMQYLDLEDLHMEFPTSQDQFVKKWFYLEKYYAEIKENLNKQVGKHTELNNKQFDELASSLKEEKRAEETEG